MHRLVAPCLVALAAVGVFATSVDAAPAPAETILVSVSHDGTTSGDGVSTPLDMSANGRFVLFSSQATNLVQGPGNGRRNLYVRDVVKGVLHRVNVGVDGTVRGTDVPYSARITPNGRYVAFSTAEGGLAPGDDADGTVDIFVRDLKKGTTALVSASATGTPAGGVLGQVRTFVIGPNGRTVAFESSASNLVEGVGNGQTQVYVRDLRKRVNRLVSVQGGGGGPSGDDADVEDLSVNGQVVLFTSRASDIVSGDANAATDVFVRDVAKGRTTLVSRKRAASATGSGASTFPKLSANGRLVAFSSDADDLVENDANAQSDVFLHDVRRGTTTLVSVRGDGASSGNDASSSAFLSPNGRYVSFLSSATDLVATPVSGTRDVFLFDVRARRTSLVSVRQDGTAGGNTLSAASAVTSNGRYVAFSSTATDLVTESDTNGGFDVFRRDMKTGRTQLVSVRADGTAAGNAASSLTSMSAKARVVLFQTSASDVSPLHPPTVELARTDAYVRRLR